MFAGHIFAFYLELLHEALVYAEAAEKMLGKKEWSESMVILPPAVVMWNSSFRLSSGLG